jgi:hypothetical protein
MGLPTEKWRISEANHSYLICPTYPSVFSVPSNVSDITLHKVTTPHSRGMSTAFHTFLNFSLPER